jgi:multidrug efflux pump subunit AcrA (membrane-fusion protein)
VGEKKMTDDELRELVASLAVTQASTAQKLDQLAEAQARTDAQLAKTDEQLAKTDAQLAKTDAQLAKTDAQLAKTDAQLAKTDAKLDKLAEMYGGVGNNQGKVAEEFYFNSLKFKPELNGIKFDFIEKNVTRSKGNLEEEYDLLLVNGEELYIVEVKYRLHPKDIERLVGRKVKHFMRLFPEYRNYRIHLALATFSVEDDVKQMALELGITLLQRRGQLIETLAA